MDICLTDMTKELCRIYFQEFEYDADTFMDMDYYKTYQYNPDDVDIYWDRQRALHRIHLAIMQGFEPVGEIILKNINPHNRSCSLSIHLKNDSCKNKGFGTAAEILVLEYAFTVLEMETVYADAVIKNTRSQHVLEKAGFQKTYEDTTFLYYRCDKSAWKFREQT